MPVKLDIIKFRWIQGLQWDNIGREPLGSRRDIVIVVEEYFLKKEFTEHYISLNIIH